MKVRGVFQLALAGAVSLALATPALAQDGDDRYLGGGNDPAPAGNNGANAGTNTGANANPGANAGANPAANPAGDTGTPVDVAPLNQRKIDLDVTKKDLREVMEFIGQKVGRNILVSPGVTAEVTVTLRDIPWLDAVKIIARLTKCDIEEAAEGVLLLTQPPKVTIQFAQAQVRTVLQLLAAYSGKNIIIAPEVKGDITLDLKEVHWLKALRSIVKTVGPYVVVEDGPDLLRVVPRESIERQLETTIIKLKYVRPPARYQATPPVGGGQAAGGTIGSPGGRGGGGGSAAGAAANILRIVDGQNPSDTFTLLRALQGVITATPANDRIEYNASDNSLILTATEPTAAAIRKIITQVDKEPAQIFMEVRFISTTDRNFFDTGLRFSGGDLQNGLQLSGPFPGGQQITSTRFQDPFITVQGQQQQQQGGQMIQGNPQAVGSFPFLIGEGRDLFERTFRIPAILDFSGLNATLNWIDSVESTRVLQEPSLFTLDNQPAVIFVGEQIPFAQTANNNDVNGNVQNAVEAGEGSPISVGFSLFLEPHLVPDTDQIIMTIVPLVNNLSGTTSPVTGFERFQFSADSFIDLPRTSVQSIVTRIMVEDGKTAVIGGLLSETETERNVSIPILSDIPLLGPLFVNRVDQRETRNLVIFVTPTIVRSQTQRLGLFDRLNNRQKKYDPIYQKRSRLKLKPKKSTRKK